jgi:hypothetical protein
MNTQHIAAYSYAFLGYHNITNNNQLVKYVDYTYALPEVPL